jgi:hypothetical protein
MQNLILDGNVQKSHLLFFISLLILVGFEGNAQKKRYVQKNNPHYDDRKMTYGFLMGLHTTSYQIKYSDDFVTPKFDSLRAVNPEWNPGFSIGFLINYRIAEFFDIRLTPIVGAFYNHEVTYTYTGMSSRKVSIETMMVEFPLLIKYKSERRGNIRMYMVGGIKPAINVYNDDSKEVTLVTKDANLNLDAGFGFDLYYPLFKLSPEIRFSRGTMNLLEDPTNKYGQPLHYINTNTIILYFIIQ